jgi:hypothetical protein
MNWARTVVCDVAILRCRHAPSLGRRQDVGGWHATDISRWSKEVLRPEICVLDDSTSFSTHSNGACAVGVHLLVASHRDEAVNTLERIRLREGGDDDADVHPFKQVVIIVRIESMRQQRSEGNNSHLR